MQTYCGWLPGEVSLNMYYIVCRKNSNTISQKLDLGRNNKQYLSLMTTYTVDIYIDCRCPDGPVSDVLQKVDVPLTSKKRCANSYRGTSRQLPNGILDASMFCAGNRTHDSCQVTMPFYTLHNLTYSSYLTLQYYTLRNL